MTDMATFFEACIKVSTQSKHDVDLSVDIAQGRFVEALCSHHMTSARIDGACVTCPSTNESIDGINREMHVRGSHDKKL
jgi:hypothetical protein